MYNKKFTSFIILILTWINLIIWDFLVYALSPDDLSNKVFFFDAQDTNWDSNLTNNTNTNNSSIANIVNKFSTNNLYQDTTIKRPLYKTWSINWFPSIYFDGINDIFDLDENQLISTWTGYSQKTYIALIKTWNNVTNFQTIYDEWTKEKWFSIQIENWNMYVWAYNSIDWTSNYKTINLWAIQTNKNYSVIFTYDFTNNSMIWYLNWIKISTLSTLEKQVNHWSCTLESSFWCTMFSTGWTLWLWGIKNDTLKLSNQSQITSYEWNYFSWEIWEISSFNYALTEQQAYDINEYLFKKWWFDNTKPQIVSTNYSSWSILPWKNHNFIFNYTDEINSDYNSWIDTASANIKLEKYNWWVYNDITSSKIWTWSYVNTAQSKYFFNNLDAGKYQISFSIKDNFWNISNTTIYTFYVDTPTMVLSNSTINIGTLEKNILKYSDTINIEVKTIGSSYKIYLDTSNSLTWSIDNISKYNWSNWFWYEKNWNLTSIGLNEEIVSVSQNINTNWILNTNNHTIKIWAIINELQTSWIYIWELKFKIVFNY